MDATKVRRGCESLACLAVASVFFVTGCATSESAGPVLVDPADATGIRPPPGVELTEQECLLGGWRLDGDGLRDYVLAFQPSADVDISGELTLGFTLERFHVEPRVGVVWQSRGDENLASLVGEAAGSYRLTDGVVELTEDRADLELVVVDQGERIRVSELFLYPITANPLAGATVSCTGDTLALTTTSGGSDLLLTLERSR